jgi:hypothetical protein
LDIVSEPEVEIAHAGLVRIHRIVWRLDAGATFYGFPVLQEYRYTILNSKDEEVASSYEVRRLSEFTWIAPKPQPLREWSPS